MSLFDAIETVTAGLSTRALARGAESLSDRYRFGETSRPLTDAERAAYLVVRAPATYAAVSAVLAELRARVPALDVGSVLDLGAGPGIGAWAALAQFERIARLTLIEQDRSAIAVGRALADAGGWPSASTSATPTALTTPTTSAPTTFATIASTPTTSEPTTSTTIASTTIAPTASASAATACTWDWRAHDLQRAIDLPSADLVLISYAIGELDAAARLRLVDAAWQATSPAGALVIVEPGTPQHVAGLLDVRAHLIARRATIAAPCPHTTACPMRAAGDWCHMAVRLARSKRHRALKGGSLAYEDEKFSYLVATRRARTPIAARIVRHPFFGKGHVKLTLCTAAGTLEQVTIGRAEGETYRQARDAAWGESWPPSQPPS